MSSEGEGIQETAPLYVWILLSVVATVSFWCQATVTEERFVPALNILALRYKIPSDVAGATLMAAGASSPELFSSIVSLFITHSALGLGTIVGSEIFNQLIITAGAVWATARTGDGTLRLDASILAREVGYYALSIGLLYMALHDVEPDPNDSAYDHIYISFTEALVLFLGYVAYVLTCAYMTTIVDFCKQCCGGRAGADETDRLLAQQTTSGGGYGSTRNNRISMKQDDLPFLHHNNHTSLLTPEPSHNFSVVEYAQTKTGERASFVSKSSEDNSEPSLLGKLKGIFGGGADHFHEAQSLAMHDTKPSHLHGLNELEIDNETRSLSCFLWQRSYFYNRAQFATQGWQLRWFTITHTSMTSVPDKANDGDKHVIRYPPFAAQQVDEKRLILRMIHGEEGTRDFYFLAPNLEILEAVERKVDEMLGHQDTTENDEPEDFEGEQGESLIELPEESSAMGTMLFYFLFPVRALMHITVPDVRVLDVHGNPVSPLGISLLANAYLSIFSCLVWLVVGSYAMVASLERLADLMDIPTAVVGVTVSAVGTSLPNYVASKVAAEKGFGNMAVSNAFGSNTFNIMVGLGLPWALYTSFGTNFQPYHGLRNEGILESVVILAAVLLVFVVVVLQSNFVLYQWHATLFCVIYAAYLAFVIGQVYL